MLYLLYEHLITRLSNYTKESEQMLHEMIKVGKIEYPDKFFGNVDPKAQDLCERILRFDPAKRISAGEILQHPWLNVCMNNT
jgi:serine/threonine protein kinase